MNEQQLQTLHKGSSHHRELLATSRVCGCFHCLSVFGYDEIRNWVQHNRTALCPRCKIDAVIGDASHPGLTRGTLEEMHRRWLEK